MNFSPSNNAARIQRARPHATKDWTSITHPPTRNHTKRLDWTSVKLASTATKWKYLQAQVLAPAMHCTKAYACTDTCTSGSRYWMQTAAKLEAGIVMQMACNNRACKPPSSWSYSGSAAGAQRINSHPVSGCVARCWVTNCKCYLLGPWHNLPYPSCWAPAPAADPRFCNVFGHVCISMRLSAVKRYYMHNAHWAMHLVKSIISHKTLSKPLKRNLGKMCPKRVFKDAYKTAMVCTVCFIASCVCASSAQPTAQPWLQNCNNIARSVFERFVQTVVRHASSFNIEHRVTDVLINATAGNSQLW